MFVCVFAYLLESVGVQTKLKSTAKNKWKNHKLKYKNRGDPFSGTTFAGMCASVTLNR